MQEKTSQQMAIKLDDLNTLCDTIACWSAQTNCPKYVQITSKDTIDKS